MVSYIGAVEKTRTSTGLPPQRPQRCASTNSATTASSHSRVLKEITNLNTESKITFHLFSFSVKKEGMNPLHIQTRYTPEPIPYEAGLVWMQTWHQHMVEGTAEPLLWFLQHTPVYTLGSSGSRHDILGATTIPVVETGRGGQVTYHGPGQRVVYLMLPLQTMGLDPKQYVFKLETWLIAALGALGIVGGRRSGRVGVWVETVRGDEKIAAIGVRVRKHITLHGIALNVSTDVTPYNNIVPCGLSQFGVTSIDRLTPGVTMAAVDRVLCEYFQAVFGVMLHPLDDDPIYEV